MKDYKEKFEKNFRHQLEMETCNLNWWNLQTRKDMENFIEQIISERDKELNYCLYALAIMYNQYVGEEGHLFMSAGETAVDVLESHGLLCADVMGRGNIPYEKYTSLINE